MGLMQVYMLDHRFQTFCLDDSMIRGADARKYRKFRGLWEECFFKKRAHLYCLNCNDRVDVSLPDCYESSVVNATVLKIDASGDAYIFSRLAA